MSDIEKQINIQNNYASSKPSCGQKERRVDNPFDNFCARGPKKFRSIFKKESKTNFPGKKFSSNCSSEQEGRSFDNLAQKFQSHSQKIFPAEPEERFLVSFFSQKKTDFFNQKIFSTPKVKVKLLFKITKCLKNFFSKNTFQLNVRLDTHRKFATILPNEFSHGVKMSCLNDRSWKKLYKIRKATPFCQHNHLNR